MNYFGLQETWRQWNLCRYNTRLRKKTPGVGPPPMQFWHGVDTVLWGWGELIKACGCWRCMRSSPRCVPLCGICRAVRAGRRNSQPTRCRLGTIAPSSPSSAGRRSHPAREAQVMRGGKAKEFKGAFEKRWIGHFSNPVNYKHYGSGRNARHIRVYTPHAVRASPDRSPCLHPGSRRTSSRRRWWRWCRCSGATSRTVGYRSRGHPRPAESLASSGSLTERCNIFIYIVLESRFDVKAPVYAEGRRGQTLQLCQRTNMTVDICT